MPPKPRGEERVIVGKETAAIHKLLGFLKSPKTPKLLVKLDGSF